MTRIGIIMLVFGIIYIVRPGIFRVGLWKKTDIAQRTLSPSQYIRYMRILGIVFAVAGILLIIFAK